MAKRGLSVPCASGNCEEQCLRRHVAPLGESICFASAFAPSKDSFLCFPFSMFARISGNLLLARSKPRNCNYIGFWYSSGTDELRTYWLNVFEFAREFT